MNELTIIEQLGLIAQSAKAEYQAVLMWVCLSVLAVTVIAVIVGYGFKSLDKMRKRNKFGALMFAALSFVMMLYAGVSDDWDFRFIAETGIYDCGSWIDEETGEIHAFWNYDPWVGSHKFKWFYTYKYDRVEYGPIQMPDAEVSARHAEFTLPTAGEDWESVVVTCYTEYVRPPAVHTNGVYHLNGVMPSMDETPGKFVTPGVQIYMNLETGESWIITPTNAPPPASALQSIHQEEDQE